jgi:undecaprenyl-diphosphatase
VAATAAILLLVPFALLTVLVVGNWAPLYDLDRTVADALHGYALGHPALVRVMAVWSFVFSPTSWRIAALLLVIWLLRRGARPLAIWVAVTMTVGGALGAILKVLVGRHRPELLEPVARAAGYAFPSGHALNNALGAGVFVLVLLPFARDRPGRRAALWIAAIMIPVLTALTVAVLLLAMIALGLFVTNAWHQGFPPSRAQVRGIEPVVWCGARGGDKIPHGRAPGHHGWKVVPRQEEL